MTVLANMSVQFKETSILGLNKHRWFIFCQGRVTPRVYHLVMICNPLKLAGTPRLHWQ